MGTGLNLSEFSCGNFVATVLEFLIHIMETLLEVNFIYNTLKNNGNIIIVIIIIIIIIIIK